MKRAVILMALLGWPWVAQAQEVRPAIPDVPRTLLICMDGLSYDLAAEMYARGELHHFLPPAPLIAAFPSDTNLSLVEIFSSRGAPPARGYEDYYYDAVRNRMRGGILFRLTRKHFVQHTYRELFDYHPDPIRMTFEYAVPVLGPWINGAVTLAEMKAEFKKSEGPVFLAYFDSSDLAAHTNGKWMVRLQLLALDRWAGELCADVNHPVDVILFSDHGNDVRPLHRANLEGALQRAGFRLHSKLKNRHSVVLTQFGLVSDAVLYTVPGREAAVAEALREAEGVDLSVYREQASLCVVGRRGTAWVDRRETSNGVRYRYRMESGDPLLLAPLAKDLADHADADQFIAEEEWLRATADHTFPDPLRRLWRAFQGLVEYPASVIVSLADGYYTGSLWLDAFACLRATHGNLRRTQSRGVVLSTNLALFLPYRGPFTGENLLARIAALREHAPPALDSFPPPSDLEGILLEEPPP